MVTPQKKPVPVYLRGLPTEVVREAKAAAAKRGVTLAGFVAESLARALESPAEKLSATTADSSNEVIEDFDTEMRWYEQHRTRLARKYAGEFVAIVDQRVIDHDTDFGKLAERVLATRGQRDTFMPKVDAEKLTPRLRSPRLVRTAE